MIASFELPWFVAHLQQIGVTEPARVSEQVTERSREALARVGHAQLQLSARVFERRLKPRDYMPDGLVAA